MKQLIYIFLFVFTSLVIISCGAYSFTGVNLGNAKSVQIDFFRNEATRVEPTLSQAFTQELQDLFTRQTNLTLTNSGGDLHFEGEIVDYREAPMSATADQTAAQTRLTVTINVRFTNKLNEKDDFEKRFSHFFDFDSSEVLVGGVLESALEEINDRITSDIFNASVAKW